MPGVRMDAEALKEHEGGRGGPRCVGQSLRNPTCFGCCSSFHPAINGRVPEGVIDQGCTGGQCLAQSLVLEISLL